MTLVSVTEGLNTDTDCTHSDDNSNEHDLVDHILMKPKKKKKEIVKINHPPPPIPSQLIE